jgi:hypothetical protein
MGAVNQLVRQNEPGVRETSSAAGRVVPVMLGGGPLSEISHSEPEIAQCFHSEHADG